MESMWWRFLAGVGVMAMMAAFGLLMAFPIMWCWNFAVVHVWGLPTLTWGQAWCMSFLSQCFIKPSITEQKRKS